jgi:hypothetical protein
MFGQFDEVANTFARAAFDRISGPATTVYWAFVSLFFLWEFGWKGLRGKFDLMEFVERMLVIAAVGVGVKTSALFWSYVYEPARAVMSGVTQLLVSQAEVSDASMSGMLKAVETEINKVLLVSGAMFEDSNWYEVLNMVCAFFLIIPYIFVWMIFLAFLVEGSFKLLAVTAIGPILVMLAAFQRTRGITTAGLRIMMNGVLTVVFAGVAMGFTIQIVGYYTAGFPVDGNGELTINADQFALSKEYFAIVLIGLLSALFHLKAAELASNLSGATSSAGAAAAVVGAGMGGFGAIKAAGFMAARRGAQAAGGVAKSFARARFSERIADRSSALGQMLDRVTR